VVLLCVVLSCVRLCGVPCCDGVVPYRVVSCGCVVARCRVCSDYCRTVRSMSPWLPRSNSEGLLHLTEMPMYAHGRPRTDRGAGLSQDTGTETVVSRGDLPTALLSC
jgi:hypothetical protein